MPTTNSQSRRWWSLALIALPVIALVFFLWNRHHDEVFVEVRPIHTSTGWGYNILTDGKIYIHQEFIPAVTGRVGFKSEAEAVRVGQRVVEKIGNRELPSITLADLKELGISFDTALSK